QRTYWQGCYKFPPEFRIVAEYHLLEQRFSSPASLLQFGHVSHKRSWFSCDHADALSLCAYLRAILRQDWIAAHQTEILADYGQVLGPSQRVAAGHQKADWVYDQAND